MPSIYKRGKLVYKAKNIRIYCQSHRGLLWKIKIFHYMLSQKNFWAEVHSFELPKEEAVKILKSLAKFCAKN